MYRTNTSQAAIEPDSRRPFLIEAIENDQPRGAIECRTLQGVFEEVGTMRSRYGEQASLILKVPKLWVDPDACTSLGNQAKRNPENWIREPAPWKPIGDLTVESKYRALQENASLTVLDVVNIDDVDFIRLRAALQAIEQIS